MAKEKVGQALRDAMKVQRAKKGGDSPKVGVALKKRPVGNAGNSNTIVVAVEKIFQSGNSRDEDATMDQVVSSNNNTMPILDSTTTATSTTIRRSRADSFDDSISDSEDFLLPHLALLPSMRPLQTLLLPREPAAAPSDDLASLLMSSSNSNSNPPSYLMPTHHSSSNAVHMPAALLLGRERMYAPDHSLSLGGGVPNTSNITTRAGGVQEDYRLSARFRSLWSDHDLSPNPVAFSAGRGVQKKQSVKLPEDELQFLRANSDPLAWK
jgi:hypothetical protein